MAEDDALRFPRERQQVIAQGSQDLVFQTAERVCGIHFSNQDDQFEAAVELRSAPDPEDEEDEGALYLTHVVPKKGEPGSCQYLAMPFYAEGGLSLVLGGASNCEITVFWVARERAPRQVPA